MAASSVDTSPRPGGDGPAESVGPGEDGPAESVGPGEDEDDPDPADPHPDFPDDFDDDVASRESEEAVTEPPSPR
jgi:hypothetical protein